MREKAVAACLMAFKFVPDLLLTTKMLEILDIVIFSNDDIDLNYKGSNIVTFLVTI